MAKSSSAGHARRAVAAVVVGLVAIGVFATVGLAGDVVGGLQSGSAPSQPLDGKKVAICHKGKKTISVSVSARPAHLRHGDTEGACVKTEDAKKTQSAKKAEKAKPASTTPSTAAAAGDADDDAGGAPGSGQGNGKGKGNGNGHS